MHVASSCSGPHTVGHGEPNGEIKPKAEDWRWGRGTRRTATAPAERCGEPLDPSTTPVVTIAAAVAVAAHGRAPPNLYEWQHSLHSRVTFTVADGSTETGESRTIRAAAVIGAVRRTTPRRSRTWTLCPDREDVAQLGQTCSTCHNPHEKTLDAQLRNPSFSTISSAT